MKNYQLLEAAKKGLTAKQTHHIDTYVLYYLLNEIDTESLTRALGTGVPFVVKEFAETPEKPVDLAIVEEALKGMKP